MYVCDFRTFTELSTFTTSGPPDTLLFEHFKSEHCTNRYAERRIGWESFGVSYFMQNKGTPITMPVPALPRQ